ncbi:hypothetical protein HHK36_005633 [Tetracentron sinense]|uniref:Uncharacterized protein n=1 Tax=Tetracentron sinense TaxID=13715 RepID=A0A834ZPT7_TETSI|nr:hypothetical protein HHK36_005633 [Tetracentron sinense]
MGNCLKHESSMTWASDECGSPESEKQFTSNTQYDKLNDKFERMSKIEEEARLREKGGVSPSTEVKIKITKKQLEELLGRVDVKGLSVEQVLAQLGNGVRRSVSDPAFESWLHDNGYLKILDKPSQAWLMRVHENVNRYDRNYVTLFLVFAALRKILLHFLLEDFS